MFPPFITVGLIIFNFFCEPNNKKKKKASKQTTDAAVKLKFNMIQIYWLGAAEFLVYNSNKFFQALESAISKLA